MKVKDILKEDDFADLGLKGHGSDLDKDQYDKDYDTPMIQQLGKILDSKGNEKLIETIYEAIARKPKGHDFDYSRQRVAGEMGRHMSTTGG